jgi:hypothetical protein
MLPDSFSDEPNSHGFISYSAQLKPGLAVGTEIKNKAYIYFDYQKPIITNTTLNKLVINIITGNPIDNELTTKSNIRIYPNPNNGLIHIQNNGASNIELNLFDINGRFIQSIGNFEPKTHTTYPLQHLGSGLYFLKTSMGEVIKISVQRYLGPTSPYL